jgi:hypothetical protein
MSVFGGRSSDTKYWLDQLLYGSEDGAPDDDFEIDDPSVSMPNMLPTTSSKPERPRTIKAGFDYKNNKMIVVFRDGTWWQYNGVPVEIWEGFKSAPSKGKYLYTSGLDAWPDMGEADMDTLSVAQKTQINDMKSYLNYLYRGK